jgi:hypothetical protein
MRLGTSLPRTASRAPFTHSAATMGGRQSRARATAVPTEPAKVCSAIKWCMNAWAGGLGSVGRRPGVLLKESHACRDRNTLCMPLERHAALHTPAQPLG